MGAARTHLPATPAALKSAAGVAGDPGHRTYEQRRRKSTASIEGPAQYQPWRPVYSGAICRSRLLTVTTTLR